MLSSKKAFYLFSWIRYLKTIILKGWGKISRREALYIFLTRLQRENTMIIINVTIRYILSTKLQKWNCNDYYQCNHQVYSTHEVKESKCGDYY